jgi:hypothetical protein
MRNFLGGDFCEKYFGGKKKVHHKFPFFFGKQFAKTEIYISREFKNCHNCPQYERVLEIFTIHILNIAKFG